MAQASAGERVMENDMASDGLSALRPEPGIPVSAVPASIPDAEAEATNAARLGEIYREVKAAEWACAEIGCKFPHDGNCWCFNTALARFCAQGTSAGTAKTEGLGAQPAGPVGETDAPEVQP
jgi:hypothetical protein